MTRSAEIRNTTLAVRTDGDSLSPFARIPVGPKSPWHGIRPLLVDNPLSPTASTRIEYFEESDILVVHRPDAAPPAGAASVEQTYEFNSHTTRLPVPSLVARSAGVGRHPRALFRLFAHPNHAFILPFSALDAVVQSATQPGEIPDLLPEHFADHDSEVALAVGSLVTPEAFFDTFPHLQPKPAGIAEGLIS